MAETSTGEKIKECFQKLVIEKGFSRVTISEICCAAGICRKTFYSHFADKYDLVASICSDDVAAEAKKIYPILAPVDCNLSSSLISERIFCSIYERKEFYLSFRSRDDVHALEAAFREASSKLHASLSELYGDGKGERVDYAIAFGSGSYASVVLHWISTGMKVSSRELANWVCEWQKPVAKEGFSRHLED